MIPPDEEVEGKIPEEGSDDTIETEEPGQDEHVVSKVAHYIRVCLPFFLFFSSVCTCKITYISNVYLFACTCLYAFCVYITGCMCMRACVCLLFI